jgi:hypothetical protein
VKCAGFPEPGTPDTSQCTSDPTQLQDVRAPKQWHSKRRKRKRIFP